MDFVYYKKHCPRWNRGLVQFFQQKDDEKKDLEKGFYCACAVGYTQLVDALVPLLPSIRSSSSSSTQKQLLQGLHLAIEKNEMPVVRLLVEKHHVQPIMTNFNLVLQYDHEEILHYLWPQIQKLKPILQKGMVWNACEWDAFKCLKYMVESHFSPDILKERRPLVLDTPWERSLANDSIQTFMYIYRQFEWSKQEKQQFIRNAISYGAENIFLYLTEVVDFTTIQNQRDEWMDMAETCQIYHPCAAHSFILNFLKLE